MHAHTPNASTAANFLNVLNSLFQRPGGRQGAWFRRPDRRQSAWTKWRRAYRWGAAAFLVACHGKPLENENRLRLALSPASFPQAISLQQQVQVQQSGRSIDFDAVLDVTPEAVTLVGLAYSQRVFTLRYDGRKLEESRSKMLPQEVRAADVLSDIQLALWPAEAVRAALPDKWTLTSTDSERSLSEGDTLRTVITYSGTPRWTGTITLLNKQFDYRLIIRSAVQP